MRLAILSLWALVACGAAPDRRDVRTGCTLAIGALEICGEECAPALDIVRVACTVLSGGQVDACQVALEASKRLPPPGPQGPIPVGGPAYEPGAGPPGPPGGASLPSAPPGASPTDAPSSPGRGP